MEIQVRRCQDLVHATSHIKKATRLDLIPEDTYEVEMAKEPKKQDLISPDQFSKSDMDTEMLTLITSLNKLHQKIDSFTGELHSEEEGKEGITPRLTQVVADASTALGESASLKFEVGILKGVVHKQQQQISMLTSKINDFTARQMNDNLIVTGILPSEESDSDDSIEDCEKMILVHGPKVLCRCRLHT